MGFYDDHVLPRLLHLAMKTKRLEPYRQRAAGAARGRVLEIGIGSGLNLPFYSPHAQEIIGLEPHAGLRNRVVGKATLLAGSAEAIPLDTDSVDTVVSTWTLCSIPDVSRALKEIRRVLKPDGRLVFVEHGRAEDTKVRRRQEQWTPTWGRFTGGCHLDRAIDVLIREAGFQIEELHTGYAPGPKPLTFTFEGSAKPR